VAAAYDTVCKRNGGNGFVSQGLGAGLTAAAGDDYWEDMGGCSAYDNAQHGFMAEEGGFMAVDEYAQSTHNRQAGFCSSGNHSMLIAGEHCVTASFDSKRNNEHGFLAVKGGVMHVGPDAMSSDNLISGFVADGSGSVLYVGDRPSASDNLVAGFAARDGGRLECGNDGEVSPSALKRGQPSYGLSAEGQGSMLEVGSGWKLHRATSGFKQTSEEEEEQLRKDSLEFGFGVAVSGGARATVGDACKVESAVKYGFVSAGAGSELWLGAGCEASGNATNYAAIDGGRMVVGNGSIARHSRRQEGFCAIGQGSELQVGDECVAVDNFLQGFAARLGGQLVMGARCVSRGSRVRHGIHASGATSAIVAGDELLTQDSAGTRLLGRSPLGQVHPPSAT
jgi:hypothetical protein